MRILNSILKYCLRQALPRFFSEGGTDEKNPALRSTAFTLAYEDGFFVFTVAGIGHGVGMSQYGAKLMAEEGTDYAAILAHDYPGTELVRLNA